jgi:hypothetical protein
VRSGALLGLALLLGARGTVRQQGPATAFDHAKHAKLFVSCATCHRGIEQGGAAVFPTADGCASCHDGTAVKRVAWQPRPGPRPGNLRFDHQRHASLRQARGDTAATCADCHSDRPGAWMQVRGPSAPQCLACHTPGRTDHLGAPDSACARCHVTLARASALPVDRIAKFPAPLSHRSPGFMGPGGHGALARPASGTIRVAQSCATCHAKEFCVACHVNAPEVVSIQALESDTRSLRVRHELKAPASHRSGDFESGHGQQATKQGATCATCHTQESCQTCHRAESPRAVLALFRAGPGRGEGAVTARRAPTSHVPGWSERHAPVATVSMRTCTSCHTRDSCLACHRPDAARRGSYHPASYLTRHPADAYTRSSTCSDCHNTGEFCQQCHAQAGLSTKRGQLGPAGYHDGNRNFVLGHGRAARQSLESCVSCHVERDCLTCHSVVKGRGYNPHGPGFDPERMLRKNPSLCIACHGISIPRRTP